MTFGTKVNVKTTRTLMKKRDGWWGYQNIMSYVIHFALLKTILAFLK